MIPKGRFEYNLNTLVLLAGIVIGILTTGISWGVFASRLENSDAKTTDWINRHEALHRDRQAAAQSTDARMEARIGQLESEYRKIDNLSYRITIVEQAGINTGKAIERLQETVNGQATDLRVMRQIIEQQFGPNLQPRPTIRR